MASSDLNIVLNINWEPPPDIDLDQSGLIERFAEAQDAYSQQTGAERRHAEHVGPERVEPHAFDECAADDDEVIAQWIEISEPLQDNGHAADRKGEARQREHRIEHEKIRGEGLLLRLADGRYQNPEPECAEQEQHRAHKQDQRVAEKRDPEPHRAEDRDQRHLGEADEEKRHRLAEDKLVWPDGTDHELFERAD